MSENMLFFGDNLNVLRQHMDDESIDLVYLDPPFKSNQDYNVLFAEQDGSRSAAQIKAFEDTWQWDQEAAIAYQEAVEADGGIALAMQAFRLLLGNSDMLAYLSMMAPRLLELRRVLKSTGSIYLHCDPTASHYLKLLMDAVFKPEHFFNEIIWQRTSAHNDPNKYGRVHDVLLFYGKSNQKTWNQHYDPPDEDYFRAHDFERDEQGKPYRKRDLTAPAHGYSSGQYEWKGKLPSAGRMWSYTEENMRQLEAEGRIVYTKSGMPRLKIYVDTLKGVLYQDVWVTSKLWLNSAAQERLGYPTQKSEALLKRIINVSSNEGDIILDPFCGCGTAIIAAQSLNRRWQGIDVTYLATNLIKSRLKDVFGDAIDKTYGVIGEPTSVPDAEALALQDRFEFQCWALGLVGARPAVGEQKKGRDKGIDGRLFFHDDRTSGQTKQIVFSVKSGPLKPDDIRALHGVTDREKAQIGTLITLKEPTRFMRSEAASMGFYDSSWSHPDDRFQKTRYPRLQILTIEELLNGKGIDRPPHQGNVTFKRAPRVTTKKEHQEELF